MPSRSGTALVVVLVVVMLLTLGAYTFSETMIVERQASSLYGKQAQTRALADSGIEYAATLMGQPTDGLDVVNLYHEPDQFQAVSLPLSESGNYAGHFTIVVPLDDPSIGNGVRYGLSDESAKLNINDLMLDDLLDDVAYRERLMMLPNMTEAIADAILDWIDEDDETREQGAESDVYSAAGYEAKNGPLETLDELLKVSEVTPWLLFGEDANRNGILDANENDGSLSLPDDNADGVLDRGWAAFLTVHGIETNLRSDGSSRIDLNQPLLTELYDAIEPELGEEVAQFIVAFRMRGPSNLTEEELELSAGAIGDGSDISEADIQELAIGIATAIAGAEDGEVTRGGLDLTDGATTEIKSLYDLVDAEVEVEIDGASQTLISPWTSDATSLQGDFVLLEDALTPFAADTIRGRINVNEASRDTLLTIPGMIDTVADSIVGSRPISSDGLPMTDLLASHSSTSWLVAEELIDVQTMRLLDRYMTAKGSVYTVQVVGFLPTGGPMTRLEAVIDGTQLPPQVIRHRDLTHLGRAFGLERLMQMQSGP